MEPLLKDTENNRVWRSFTIECGACGHNSRPNPSVRVAIEDVLCGWYCHCRKCEKQFKTLLVPNRLTVCVAAVSMDSEMDSHVSIVTQENSLNRAKGLFKTVTVEEPRTVALLKDVEFVESHPVKTLRGVYVVPAQIVGVLGRYGAHKVWLGPYVEALGLEVSAETAASLREVKPPSIRISLKVGRKGTKFYEAYWKELRSWLKPVAEDLR